MTYLRLAATLLLLAAAGCKGPGREPDPAWQVSDVAAPSDRVLWKVALLSLDRQGYPLGSGLDPSSMELVSGWKSQLAPFSGKGFRTRAELRMEPVEKGRWKVRARVAKQINKSLSRPLDPSYAEWKWVPDDTVSAQILLQHVRSFLETEIELRDRPSDPVEAYLEGRKEAQEDE